MFDGWCIDRGQEQRFDAALCSFTFPELIQFLMIQVQEDSLFFQFLSRSCRIHIERSSQNKFFFAWRYTISIGNAFVKHYLQNQLLRGNLTLNSQDHTIIYLQLFGRQKRTESFFAFCSGAKEKTWRERKLIQ